MTAFEIVQPTLDDFDQLLPMLDRAFGREPGNFQQLLPSLYQRADNYMRCHYALREEKGEFVAALGVYPLQWHVGDHVLRVAGIGGVGTDPDWRGKGLMSKLLQHAVDQIREQEYDLSWLGGQRQRYRYFGWEKAGCLLEFRVTQANLRHEPATQALPRVELAALDDDDASALALMCQWHDAQPIHCLRRTRSFKHVLRDWRALPHVARDEQGEVVGYVVLSKDSRAVVELVGRDETIERALVCAAVEQAESGEIAIMRPPLGSSLNRWLIEIAEGVTCSGMGNWQVFDWPATVQALLSTKCAHHALPAGAVVVGLHDQPQALEMSVDGHEAHVQWTDRSPSLTLDSPTLIRTLLGPLPPSQVVELPSTAALLEAWCPLPAALPYQDKV